MQCYSYINTLSAISAYQLDALASCHPEYIDYLRGCALTYFSKFMLADEMLCSFSQAHNNSYTEDDANLYDVDEREEVIKLINIWIYEHKYY